MTEFKNARLNQLAKEQAEHNLNVLGNLSARFAKMVNSELEFESQQKALTALKVFDATVVDLLGALIQLIKRGYTEDNAWTDNVFTGGKGKVTNHYAKSPLSKAWVDEKQRRIKHHNRKVKREDEKIKFSKDLYRLTNHNPLQLTHFHGLGYFNVQPESNNSIKQESLKEWVAQLDLTSDANKLYSFLGRARLTVTGPLATRKGFQQLNGGFYTDSGQYDTLEDKLRYEKKATQKQALKQKAPYRAFQGQGLYLHVEKGKTPYAFLKGRRVSLLDLNRAGLIGSRLTIAAFDHQFRGMNPLTGRIMLRHSKAEFFEQAKKDKANDIFGEAAGTKLWFSAKKGRTPITTALKYTLSEFLPSQFQQRLGKLKS